MICFRDMTFCCSDRHKPTCERQWTPELAAAAEQWWGGPDAPVMFASFCGGYDPEADADAADRTRDRREDDRMMEQAEREGL